MREILFRGKRVDNGEWVYGLLCRVGNTYANIVEKSTEVMCTVLTNTIGQFTGLTDKNGRKIFEGDVLNVHDQIPTFDGYNTDEIIYNGKVMYIKNQGMYVCEGNNDGNALCALNLDKCEVIGNIHDNPELLGGESDG